MKVLKVSIILAVIACWVLVACTPAGQPQDAPTAAPEVAQTQAPANPSTDTTSNASDPQNATYLIDGKEVTLVNGVSEQEAAPGSATKIVTKYFGNAVDVDLNSDGLMDSGFLLTQDGGGSGTFFYVAGAVNTGNGDQGTNAIFIGDRIAPQSTNVDPNNPAQFIVNYAERKLSDPMSAPPSVAVSRTFKLDNGTLVEVGTPPTQTP
jgi:hypothetical protein